MSELYCATCSTHHYGSHHSSAPVWLVSKSSGATIGPETFGASLASLVATDVQLILMENPQNRDLLDLSWTSSTPETEERSSPVFVLGSINVDDQGQRTSNDDSMIASVAIRLTLEGLNSDVLKLSDKDRTDLVHKVVKEIARENSASNTDDDESLFSTKPFVKVPKQGIERFNAKSVINLGDYKALEGQTLGCKTLKSTVDIEVPQDWVVVHEVYL